MDIPFDFVDDRNTHVLIIDDDINYAQSLKNAITIEIPGVEVITTDDGYEGLLLIGEIKPQLVVLDIKMPKVDGFQVLELLRSRKIEHDMKILVVSGYLDAKTRQQLSKTVVDYAMDKLSDLDAIIKTIVAIMKSEKPEFTEALKR